MIRVETRGTALSVALGAAAGAVVIVLGHAMFFTLDALFVTAPLTGLIAALACRRPVPAAAAGALGVGGGLLLAVACTRLPITYAAVLALAPGVMLVAAMVAGAVGYLLSRIASAATAIAWMTLALVLACMCASAMTYASMTQTDGSTIKRMLTGEPTLTAKTHDEDLYLIYVRRVQAGQDYYRAAASTLAEANAVRAGTVDLSSPLSVRLPTLYVALAALPPDPVWLIWAVLACGAVGAVSAYALARQWVAPALALVGPVAIAALVVGEVAQYTLLGTELYAGTLGLVSVTLIATARRDGARRHLVWLAPSAALGAALVREMGLAFVVLGLVVSLVDADDRKRRVWGAWVAAAAIASLAYVLHWSAAGAAAAALVGSAGGVASGATWFHIDAAGFAAAVTRLSEMLSLQPAVALVAWIVAAVGSFLAAKDAPRRVALAGAVVGGTIAVTFLYPAGQTVTGVTVGYWSDLVVPTALACVPLLGALLPGGAAVDGERPVS